MPIWSISIDFDLYRSILINFVFECINFERIDILTTELDFQSPQIDQNTTLCYAQTQTAIHRQ